MGALDGMSESARGEDSETINPVGRGSEARVEQGFVAGRGSAVGAFGDVIVPTDCDVLSGRGKTIASHPGNLRFRRIVSEHYDKNYCSSYRTIEKRALADSIIKHIEGLNPPGRFLVKKSNRSRSSSDLGGPWELMTYESALKKTVQALRDANREDRSGYAKGVPVTEDVKRRRKDLERLGLTNREFAKKIAVDFVANIKVTPGPTQRNEGTSVPDPTASLPHSPADIGSVDSSQWTNSSPEMGPSPASHARLPNVTPGTAVGPPRTASALFDDDRKMPSRDPFFTSDTLPPSPHDDTLHHASLEDSPHLSDNFDAAFKDTTTGPSSNDPLDFLAARAAAGLEEHGSHASARHDEYRGLFHDVDDDVEICAEHAFEDPKF